MSEKRPDSKTFIRSPVAVRIVISLIQVDINKYLSKSKCIDALSKYKGKKSVLTILLEMYNKLRCIFTHFKGEGY
ncbi:MAG: hypothetical protein RMJ31_07570 [Nitrososphaerota archaeon]|nr:hypothetical protein [Nitrososphaerota archaeon]